MLKNRQNIQENLHCEADLLWILHVKASKKYAGRTSTCIFFHIEHITWHSVVREEETKFVQHMIAKRYPHYYIQKCMTKKSWTWQTHLM